MTVRVNVSTTIWIVSFCLAIAGKFSSVKTDFVIISTTDLIYRLRMIELCSLLHRIVDPAPPKSPKVGLNFFRIESEFQ